MTQPTPNNSPPEIITANCMRPGCTFTWIGWRSKIAAQLHANRTGHAVDVQTTTTMNVEKPES